MRERERDPKELSTADIAARDERTTDAIRDDERQRFMRQDEDTRAHEMHADDRTAPLMPEDELGRLQARWREIMAGFVDEPKRSVEAADGLVASTMKEIAEAFANTRSQLESQWSRGGDVSTEDLRLALRQYRSFFERLVAV